MEPDVPRHECAKDSSLVVEVCIDEQVASPVDSGRIEEAVRLAAGDQGFLVGEIGVRVTDDASIHQINRDFLSHDYPTDVISFDYLRRDDRVEGELVVSVDTASGRAGELGGRVDDELLLYVIHGTLHVVGLDDRDEECRRLMRQAERRVLQKMGINDVPSVDAAHESRHQSPQMQAEEES